MTDSKFCGQRCCKVCAVRKHPLPCKKEERAQICDLCNRKFKVLMIKDEYHSRLDKHESKEKKMKRNLGYLTKEVENLSVQLASITHSADSELRNIKNDLQKARTWLEQLEMQSQFQIQSN